MPVIHKNPVLATAEADFLPRGTPKADRYFALLSMNLSRAGRWLLYGYAGYLSPEKGTYPQLSVSYPQITPNFWGYKKPARLLKPGRFEGCAALASP